MGKLRNATFIPLNREGLKIKSMNHFGGGMSNYNYVMTNFCWPMIELSSLNPHINSDGFKVALPRDSEFSDFLKSTTAQRCKELFNFHIVPNIDSNFSNIDLRGFYKKNEMTPEIFITVQKYLFRRFSPQTGDGSVMLIAQHEEKSILNSDELIHSMNKFIGTGVQKIASVNFKTHGMKGQVDLIANCKAVVFDGKSPSANLVAAPKDCKFYFLKNGAGNSRFIKKCLELSGRSDYYKEVDIEDLSDMISADFSK